MSHFQLSRSAAQDIRDIGCYTRERFGLRQSVRIRERFLDAFRLLASAPQTGLLREDHDPPGKTFRYRALLGTFVVVYEPVDQGIRVARVLHGARNLVRELEFDAGDEG